MLAVAELTPHVGLSSACQAFALNRGFVYRDRARRHGIASRCVPRARPRPPLALSVGWLIAHRESAELAEQFIADTLDKEDIAPGTLTLHADRGTSMRSKPVAALLIDLEVAKT